MPRLTWDAYGTRFFESGVDRGVLYTTDDPGVSWSGLVSVAESPSGGESRAFYQEGIKYLNIAAAEEYEATINALSAPREFDPCDGTVHIQNGLYVTQQRRQPFSFSYRTMIGNDADGADHAYKIHLVYNALAAPSQATRNSRGSTADPSVFSWSVTTLPPPITGYRRTSHLVIDSRYADPTILSDFEDVIYGTEADFPSLPLPNDVIELFA